MPRTPPLSDPLQTHGRIRGRPRAPRRTCAEAWSWRFSPRYGGSPRAVRSRSTITRSVLAASVGTSWSVGRSRQLFIARATLRARNKNCVQVGVPLNDGNNRRRFERGRRGDARVRAWCRDRGVVTEGRSKGSSAEGTTLVADCRRQDRRSPDQGSRRHRHEEAGEEYSKCSKILESSQSLSRVVES